VVYEEAENRLHVQKAVMTMMMGGTSKPRTRRNPAVKAVTRASRR
jgi:hypothetical protein